MKIGAILVLYNPNKSITEKAIRILARQVDEICLIDNSLSENEEYGTIVPNADIPLKKCWHSHSLNEAVVWRKFQ